MSDDPNDTREPGHSLDEAPPAGEVISLDDARARRDPVEPSMEADPGTMLAGFMQLADAYSDDQAARAAALLHARLVLQTADENGEQPPPMADLVVLATWILTGRFDGE